MLQEAFPDKLTPDIDFRDKSVVHYDMCQFQKYFYRRWKSTNDMIKNKFFYVNTSSTVSTQFCV